MTRANLRKRMEMDPLTAVPVMWNDYHDSRSLVGHPARPFAC